MSKEINNKIMSMAPEKILAIAAYGESVAAFRYRHLAEKAPTDELRKIFTEIADEEQEHHQLIKSILEKKFDNADFILTSDDKALVITGTRNIDVSSPESYEKSMKTLYESELQTGQFYQQFYEFTTDETLKPVLKEMADECIEHAESLKDLPKPF